MEVSKPLIANKYRTSPQILQVSAIARKETLRAELSYASVNSRGEEIAQHAKCVVEYKDKADWLSDWVTTQFLVQERIDALKKAEGKGVISKITKGLAYKLFATFVQYEPKYRGMDVVILDSAKLEATASVTFQTNEGNYFCSPYWIDSLAHLSGFILNCSDTTDSGNFVFISHGWKSMRFSQHFSDQKTYQTYVRMQPRPKDIYEGTVYIFDVDTRDIVGVVGGLKFQRIPSKVLSHVLSTASPKASQGPVQPRQLMRRTTSIPTTSKKILHPSLQEREVPLRPASPLPQSKSLVAHVFEVIAQNMDIDPSEFHDETCFIDVGVDSIMSMTIVSQLRELLDIDIPATLLLEQPTVKSLRTFLTQIDIKSPLSDTDTYLSSSESSVISRPTTAATSADNSDDDTAGEDADEMDTDNLISTIRSTISEQMGIPMAEIMNDTDLSSLGMDSLMSLSILGDLREETGQDFPSDFFIENQSIGSIKRWRKRECKAWRSDKLGLSNVIPTWEKPKTIDLETYPPARSFLLQGRQKMARRTLFLFPDGSGSASSYTRIPPISPDLAVYAFNCPFMTTPEQFTVGIPGVATLYLAEIRRRQPVGPYVLGGWSAGGVIAYEVMQQLLVSGESVEKLILLDAPCPLDIVRLPPRLHHFFGDIGLLGDLAEAPTSAAQKKKSIPDWLLPHFQYCIDALVTYKPQPIPIDNATKAPKVFAIWARYGVCRSPEDPRPDFPIDEPPHLKWLLENRMDFGSNGWDRLIPGRDKIRTEVLDGNHFTIMKDKLVSYSPFIYQSSPMVCTGTSTNTIFADTG
jgi:iterative type I PKS product template protein